MTSSSSSTPFTDLPIYAILRDTERPFWLCRMEQLGIAAQKPQNNKIFKSPKACLIRLNIYGFAAGCKFATLWSKSTAGHIYQDYTCHFYSNRIKNS